jgi:hypothetical protein
LGGSHALPQGESQGKGYNYFSKNRQNVSIFIVSACKSTQNKAIGQNFQTFFRHYPLFYAPLFVTLPSELDNYKT